MGTSPQIKRVGDPELFDPHPADAAERLVLGLDMGTSCGYCYSHYRPGRVFDPAALAFYAGQWDLSAGPYDSGAIRFVRLRRFLSVLKPDLIAYEDVKYNPPAGPSARAILARAATSCEWFGALKATVATWAEENHVPCYGVSIQHIKKRATGRGNASKLDLIHAANRLFGFDLPEDYEACGADNVADACFACLLAGEQHALGLHSKEPA